MWAPCYLLPDHGTHLVCSQWIDEISTALGASNYHSIEVAVNFLLSSRAETDKTYFLCREGAGKITALHDQGSKAGKIPDHRAAEGFQRCAGKLMQVVQLEGVIWFREDLACFCYRRSRSPMKRQDHMRRRKRKERNATERFHLAFLSVDDVHRGPQWQCTG